METYEYTDAYYRLVMLDQNICPDCEYHVDHCKCGEDE